MVKVSWMDKKVVGNEVIREVKSAKDFKKPQKFDAFIDSIAKTFGIKKKRNISLILINDDNEEIAVKSQEDFDEFLEDLKEFKFYLEEGEQSEAPIKKKESKKEDLKSKDKDESDEENKPEKKKEDDDDGNDEDEDGEGGNDGLPADVSDKEIENIFDRLIKPIPELDDDLNDDNQFDKEAYSKQLNDNFTKAVNQFKNVFDEKINKIIVAKSQIMTNSISSLIKDFSKIHLKNLDDISDKTNGLQEGFSTIMTNTNEMNDAIGKLKGEIKGEKKPKPKNPGTVIEEEDDDEPNDNKIQFKFSEDNLKEEFEAKKCKWLDINDVEIENFGDKDFNCLYFVKDPSQSSKDISFIGNTVADQEANKLTLSDMFKAGEKGKFSITLKINNPKIGEQYKLCLNVRSKVKGSNLSKPLFINIKVKENEEDRKKKEDEKRKEEENRRKEEEENRRKEEEEKKRQEEEDKKRKEEEENRRKEEEKRKKEEEEKKIKEQEEKKRQEEEKKRKEEEDKEEEKKKKEEEEKNNEIEIDYKGLDKDEVNALYKELDDEFNLTSILDKKAVLEKIIDVQCNREVMNDWIFEKL
jgi:hypothetical protein